MKKLFLLFAFMSPMYLSAQEKQKTFKKITASVYFGGTISLKEKEYIGSALVLPSINAFTERSHHHLQYDVDAGDVVFLNVITLKEYYGAYVLLSKNTEEKEQYAGIGFERDFEIKQFDSELITFVEIGTSFEKNLKYSLGVLLNVTAFSFRK